MIAGIHEAPAGLDGIGYDCGYGFDGQSLWEALWLDIVKGIILIIVWGWGIEGGGGGVLIIVI